MPELQHRFLSVVVPLIPGVAAVEFETAPSWLLRPGIAEFGRRAPMIAAVYHELTGLRLPEVAPLRERRRVDAVIRYLDGSSRVLEFDERQHFTSSRLATLSYYDDIAVAFDAELWRRRSAELSGREPRGGFARPCPPLFPGPGGRHRQRAFRDLLADVLPAVHDWRPTARIQDLQALEILRGSAVEENARQLWLDITTETG